jgi:hypothetical protein
MAISLAFGVLFATMITLILVPALYLIIEDAKSLFHRSEAEPETESRTMAAPLLFPERKQAS